MNEPSGPSGYLVIDKPAGITSFDVIRELRGSLHIRKLGHSGVLDKPATGVLVIGANRATRLFDLFSVYEKEYTADIWLGLSTTTDDLAGELLEAGRAPPPAREALEQALRAYSGAFLQAPPAFSLVKKGGRELYRYALAGQEVAVEPKPVAMLDCAVLDFETGLEAAQAVPAEGKLAPDLPRLGRLARARIALRCTGGFYVRSLARDVGADLGTYGVLGQLVRTRVGPFTLGMALSLTAVAGAVAGGKSAAELLLPLATIAPEEARLSVDEQQLSLLRHGRPISRFKHLLPPAATGRGDTLYAIAPDGELAAVLTVQGTNQRGLVELRISRQLL
jgi:tRNA pseudouridine55 synthase